MSSLQERQLNINNQNINKRIEEIAGRPVFTILLVDDRPENILLLEDMLTSQNRRFLKASSGLEALKIALEEPEIGLILLDVQMPEMDGYEVANLLGINPKTKNIPFLFVTANQTLNANILQGFQNGAIDYLIKPLNPAITRAKVSVFENLYLHQLGLKTLISERDIVNEQLERYTRVMAHDLKTPLAGIVGLISIIKMNEKVAEDSDLTEELDLLETLSTNLSDMITKVLQDSKKIGTETDLEDTSIEHLLRSCITLLQAPSHIRIRFQDEMPIFRTNKVKLHQVFQNLIGNALKYNNKESGLVSIGYSDETNFYKFWVKDNGPGVATQYREKIFEKFGKGPAVSNLDNSTGLGLHFVKQTIEEQGGKIWLESEPGLGSCFYFLWKK